MRVANVLADIQRVKFLVAKLPAELYELDRDGESLCIRGLVYFAEATCDKTYTRTMTYPDSWTKSHTHYAELPIDDLSLSELPHITAVRCDVSRSFGECPDDAQCEDSGAPSMDASVSKDCVETWYTVASGRIRVGCGNSSENQGGNNDWFDRADRVLVRLF